MRKRCEEEARADCVAIAKRKLICQNGCESAILDAGLRKNEKGFQIFAGPSCEIAMFELGCPVQVTDEVRLTDREPGR